MPILALDYSCLPTQTLQTLLASPSVSIVLDLRFVLLSRPTRQGGCGEMIRACTCSFNFVCWVATENDTRSQHVAQPCKVDLYTTAAFAPDY